MKILITGASSGIGRALTAKLVSEGHTVWGVARSREKLNQLARLFAPGRFFWNVCDVGNREDTAAVIAEMEKNNFLPDAVVLNAAIFSKDAEPDFNRPVFDETFGINFGGALSFIDLLLPKFIARGKGQFLAVGSTAAFRPTPRGIAYSASKAALAMAMRGFGANYAKKGVAFKTVYFGPIATKMWEGKKNFLVPRPETAAAFLARALGREKNESHFPFLSTAIFRALAFIPDNLFFKLSNLIK
jgi:short-subunit dehydrogenase